MFFCITCDEIYRSKWKLGNSCDAWVSPDVLRLFFNPRNQFQSGKTWTGWAQSKISGVPTCPGNRGGATTKEKMSIENNAYYPSHSELDKIAAWKPGDYSELIAYIEPYVNQYGRLTRLENGRVEIATGGWSGCEEIIVALQENHIFWAVCWQSSHRGGLVVFKLPT